MHRHEFSAPIDPRYNATSSPRRSPLARSAFSSPALKSAAPMPRRATMQQERPVPIINRPGRPLSESIAREHSVRFKEPHSDSMSEDGRSVANSEASEITVGGSRRRRRSRRPSTTFHFAHPAPTLTQKQRLLHIRPRLLLQLQQLSPDSRPKPAVDVLPSAVIVPRLAKKFPRIFRGKAELGVNDVLVVKSEDYDRPDNRASEESDSDDESLANRDVMAVICQVPKDAGGSFGKAEIVLSNGSVWAATPLSTGLYEFVSVDETGHRTTARWVKRNNTRSSMDYSRASFNSTDLKYTFSVMDPRSRRHPIMATLTQNTLDIPDFYTSVSSSPREEPSPSEAEHDSMEDEPVPERTSHAIGEDLRKLIQVTGIWVALRQGLSPYFKYNDAMACAPPARSRSASHGRVRSLSVTPDASRPSLSGTCTPTPESNHSTFAAVGGKLRRSCTKGGTSTASSPQMEQSNIPKRSASAGTAFMQRVVARRVGNPPSTVPSDSEGERVLRPPKIAAMENGNSSVSSPVATPTSLNLPGSSITTPDTPTRPQRRVQSTYIPSGLMQLEHPTARHSIDHMHRKGDSGHSEKPKAGRWKVFTNLFRRSQTRSA